MKRKLGGPLQHAGSGSLCVKDLPLICHWVSNLWLLNFFLIVWEQGVCIPWTHQDFTSIPVRGILLFCVYTSDCIVLVVPNKTLDILNGNCKVSKHLFVWITCILGVRAYSFLYHSVLDLPYFNAKAHKADWKQLYSISFLLAVYQNWSLLKCHLIGSCWMSLVLSQLQVVNQQPWAPIMILWALWPSQISSHYLAKLLSYGMDIRIPWEALLLVLLGGSTVVKQLQVTQEEGEKWVLQRVLRDTEWDIKNTLMREKWVLKLALKSYLLYLGMNVKMKMLKYFCIVIIILSISISFISCGHSDISH